VCFDDCFFQFFGSKLTFLVCSWFFRTFVDVRVAQLAQGADVSMFHFQRLSDHLLLAEKQEDENFARDIRAAATMLPADLPKPVVFDDLSAGKEQLHRLARQYRISKHSVDIRAESPENEVLRRVVEEAKRGSGQANQDTLGPSADTPDEQYFPDPETEEFLGWARLAISARVAHCNAHHVRTRAQWEVRDAWLRISTDLGVFDESEDAMAARLG
jgi:hypothetical protein